MKIQNLHVVFPSLMYLWMMYYNVAALCILKSQLAILLCLKQGGKLVVKIGKNILYVVLNCHVFL